MLMIMKQKHYLTFLLFMLFCTFCSVALGHDFKATYYGKTNYNDITPDSEWESTNHDDGTVDSYTFEFTVEETNKLVFDWYVSSENSYDFLNITLDGNTILSSSGENSDTFQTYVEAGEHVLIVEYIKDGSVSSGNDNAGVKNFQLYPDSPLDDNTAAVAGADFNNPIVTDFVVNGNFDYDIHGWQRTGWYVNNKLANNQEGDFTGYFWENWNDTPHANAMYQVINYIPNGTYKLTIAAFVNKLAEPNDCQFVFANDDKVFLTTEAPIFYDVYTYVTNNTIRIGLEQTEAITNWMGIDNVSLTYYGENDVANKLIWEEARNAALQTLADYPELTGSFRDALQAEVDKSEPSGSEEAYISAAEALYHAIDIFMAGKSLYENTAFVAGANKDNPVATNFVVNGYFNSSNTGWKRTGSFANNGLANNQQGDFTGNFWENWNGSAQVNKMYQQINNIPNGTYKLEIAAFVNNFENPNESQFVFANNDKVFLTTPEPTLYHVYTYVTDNTIEVGLEQTKAITNWMGIDNVSLTYYGEENVVDELENPDHPNGDWESSNHDDNSIDSYTYEFTAGDFDVLTFDWYVSSETNYDILTITLDGNVIVQSSGVDSGTYQGFPTAGNHTLIATYTKDVSASSYNDNASIKNIRITPFTAPEGNIEFADANVKAICVDHWDTNHDGELSYLEALYVTDLGSAFNNHVEITSFNELQYFTRLTQIRDDAFLCCEGMTSIVLPNSVTLIGYDAFNQCIGLTNIQLPNSIITIMPGAFLNCSGLTSIEIPQSVANIGQNAFGGCSSLTSIVVDSDNPQYDSRNNCNAIIETWSNILVTGCQNTVIPNSVWCIGSDAFFLCKDLKSIDIPNSINTISSDAFYGCTSLTSIEIPSSVLDIGYQAFYGCSGLISIEIPNSITEIREWAFAYCTGLTDIAIPNSVTIINDYAFCGCQNLMNIVIPNSVNYIGDNVFCECYGLTEIRWTPNDETEASTPLAPATCNLYLFKNSYNGDKVQALASLFDGLFNVIYVIEGTIELTAYPSEEPGDDYYYCTYYDHDLCLMTTEGYTKPFGATYGNSSLTLHAVEEEMVYADYPVIFRTTQPNVSLYVVSNISGINSADNDLQGTAEEMTVSRSDRIYVLYNGGFHLTEGTIPAHKAYLDLSSAESAPERLSFYEGDATTIYNAEDADKDADGPWYTISGQRVDQPTKGVFIKNGKKYLFK